MPQQRDPMRPAGTAELMRKRAADKAARDEAMQAVDRWNRFARSRAWRPAVTNDPMRCNGWHGTRHVFAPRRATGSPAGNR